MKSLSLQVHNNDDKWLWSKGSIIEGGDSKNELNTLFSTPPELLMLMKRT